MKKLVFLVLLLFITFCKNDNKSSILIDMKSNNEWNTYYFSIKDSHSKRDVIKIKLKENLILMKHFKIN